MSKAAKSGGERGRKSGNDSGAGQLPEKPIELPPETAFTVSPKATPEEDAEYQATRAVQVEIRQQEAKAKAEYEASPEFRARKELEELKKRCAEVSSFFRTAKHEEEALLTEHALMQQAVTRWQTQGHMTEDLEGWLTIQAFDEDIPPGEIESEFKKLRDLCALTAVRCPVEDVPSICAAQMEYFVKRCGGQELFDANFKQRLDELAIQRIKRPFFEVVSVPDKASANATHREQPREAIDEQRPETDLEPVPVPAIGSGTISELQAPAKTDQELPPLEALSVFDFGDGKLVTYPSTMTDSERTEACEFLVAKLLSICGAKKKELADAVGTSHGTISRLSGSNYEHASPPALMTVRYFASLCEKLLTKSPRNPIAVPVDFHDLSAEDQAEIAQELYAVAETLTKIRISKGRT